LVVHSHSRDPARRSGMFFGDVPKFDEILRLVGDLEEHFRAS
jgi:hypothetical protein